MAFGCQPNKELLSEQLWADLDQCYSNFEDADGEAN